VIGGIQMWTHKAMRARSLRSLMGEVPGNLSAESQEQDKLVLNAC